MGSTEEVQGYPVPANADKSQFPYDTASEVVYWGDQAGMPQVRQMVDTVRDWLGHPETVTTIASQWGTTAATAMKTSGDGINSALLDVKAYWQGGAFDAFSGYITQVLNVISENTKLMGDMGSLVQALHDKIYDTFKAGVRFIGQCASDILATGADIIGGMIPKLVGAVAEGILNALRRFVDNVTILAGEAPEIIAGYAKSAYELESKAVAMRIPDTMPTAPGYADNWKVRPI